MKVISFDGNTKINDKTNYEAYLETAPGGRQGIDPNYVGGNASDPLVGGVVFPIRTERLRVVIRAGTEAEINQIFDTRDRKPRIFLFSDDDGNNRRFVNCLAGVPIAKPKEMVIPLHVTGDPFPNAETEVALPWSITSSPATLAFNSQSEAVVFPRIVIRPLANKSGSNPYKKFVTLEWRCTRPATNYPVRILLDTTDANFTGAAGEDLRVVVNGKEVDFWVEDAKTANTKVWVILDFKAQISLTLDGAVSASDTEITFNEDITELEEDGRIKIGSEVIYYASKNNDLKRISGAVRGFKNTTAGSYSDGATAVRLQHDIEVTYGAASPVAYVIQDGDKKPAFELDTSTNDSWVYEAFGEDDGKRAASWLFTMIQTSKKFTATGGGDADPFTVIGVKSDTDSGLGKDISGFASIYVPPGITNANVTNGKKYADKPSRFTAYLRSSIDGANYTNEYTITAPTTPSSEQSWSNNTALTSGSLYFYMWLLGQTRVGSEHRIEAGDVTLTLDNTQTPTTAVGAERGNYSLDLTLTNKTAGVSVKLVKDMQINDQLELDTATFAVTDLGAASEEYQALRKLGGPREFIFPLNPGNNDIEATDTGMTNVTITFHTRDRYRS